MSKVRFGCFAAFLVAMGCGDQETSQVGPDTSASSSTTSTSATTSTHGATTSTATSSATVGAGGEGGVGGSGAGGGGLGGQPVPMFTLTGTVYSNEDGSRIPGAKVRVMTDGAEVTADGEGGSSGAFSIEVPDPSDVFLEASADGYAALVRGVHIPTSTTYRDYYLPAQATVDAFAAATHTDLDPAKGSLWLSFENAKVAGYGVAMPGVDHDPILAVDPDMGPVVSDVTLAGDVDHWFVLVPNIAAASVSFDLVVPSGHHCTPREPITEWKIYPGKITYYDADCD